MKIYVTIVLVLLFLINLADAQKMHPPVFTNSINTKIKSSDLKSSSIQQIGDKQSNNSFELKANSVSTLNLTGLIQGLYNGSVMNSINPIVVSVELHDAVTLGGIESRIGTLNSAGVGSFNFNSVVDGALYYLVIKSKSMIETWSASPVSFSTGTLNYDFTSAATQAYGSNMVLMNGKYCFYSGDITQDGQISFSDLIAVDNDNLNFVNGYTSTDITGDNQVTFSDLIIVDNNNLAFVSKAVPSGVPSDIISYAGQSYNTVLIGTQYWLKENLNVGTKISGNQLQTNNGMIEKFCYNDLPENCITYGGLYQWNEAMQYVPSGTKVQGICPSGWHVPSVNDFSILATSVGNSKALKSIGQGLDTAAGINTSGFSALLAGLRVYSTGSFSDLGIGGDGYFWSSSQYDTVNATLMDLSGYDNNIYMYSTLKGYGFSVRCVKDGWLLLQSPGGGERWKVGSNQIISWKSSNITNAKLELTTNNGTNWTTIIGSTPASDGSYSWTIPNTPSAQCKVKLSDASDTTIVSMSNNLFTIWIQTLSLSSPNGGEFLKWGDIDSIKWTSSNITNVKLEFSSNNGTNWTTIIGSTPASTGSYAWTIPNTLSANCRVRISDVSDTAANSISANKFTISNPPCPGISFVSYGGQTYNTVLIGNQCWLKENLNIGTRINGIADQTNNGILEKYCYDNNPANCTTYGGLYQWAEIVQYQNGATNVNPTSPALYGHVQGICPIGWHLSDTTEFGILTNFVNNDANSLKAAGQGAGTDISGWSALFPGVRYSDGTFNLLGLFNFFASSIEGSATTIYYIDLGVNTDIIYLGNNLKTYGRSVRCILNGSVSLTTPNGGESWQAGSSHNIIWTSSYLTNAKIELTTDNGSSWSTIIASTPASVGSYNWTVPNSPSTLCKVRISDIVDSTINSISSIVFTISPIPVITITSPNGGENWKVGAVDTVKWTSSDVTNAKIEFTTDNGTSWSTVIASTPASTGTYDWTIPNTPSANCKVKLTDVADSTVHSTSASVFTIAVVPTMSITSPNGGENWKVGAVDTVKWTSSNVTKTKIEFTTNNGTSWSTVIDSTPASTGTYDWTIPNTPSANCKVKLTDVADTTVHSTSASVFTIAVVPTMSITSPNGGENWKVGAVDTVKWTSNNVTNTKIEYTTDNGTNWSTVLASTPASTGTYDWTIPNTPSANCKVKLTDVADTTVHSTSANVFTIAVVPAMSIASPNGGENWKVGAVDTVKWTSSDVTNAKIEFTTDNGTSWSTVIASTLASTGSYDWTIPNTPSTNCKVKLSDVADTTVHSTSANIFTIAIVPTMSITSPNGGENWKVGAVDTVKWTSNNVTNTKIEYTTDNGTNWSIVIASTPASTGTYDWTIPNTPSANCKVKLTDVADTTVTSTSASVFTIAIVPTMSITSPNGGENWKVGAVDTVKWTSSNVTNTKIEYTTDNGTNWSIVIASTPASTGTYDWTIPNTPSANCKVKLTDVADTTVTSSSTSVFTISEVPTISIISPNGGENWKVGEVDTVKWTSSNITNAKIEYTTDNGTNWTTIITSTPASSGSFEWTIPNTPSVDCKVRVSDESDAIINSESAGIFTIAN